MERQRARVGEESGLSARRFTLAEAEVRSALGAAEAGARESAWRWPGPGGPTSPPMPSPLPSCHPIRPRPRRPRHRRSCRPSRTKRTRRRSRRSAPAAFSRFPTLQFGWQQVSDGGAVRSGPIFAAGWTVPLFDRDQAARVEAERRQLAAAARVEVTRARVTAEVEGSAAAYRALAAASREAASASEESDRVIAARHGRLPRRRGLADRSPRQPARGARARGWGRSTCGRRPWSRTVNWRRPSDGPSWEEASDGPSNGCAGRAPVGRGVRLPRGRSARRGPSHAAPEGWAVTAWGERYEVFAETDALVAGASVTSDAHVTVLEGFAPLKEGAVTLVLRGAGGAEEAFRQERPKRDGIYPVEAKPRAEGTFDLVFRIESAAGPEEIAAGRVRVGSRGRARRPRRRGRRGRGRRRVVPQGATVADRVRDRAGPRGRARRERRRPGAGEAGRRRRGRAHRGGGRDRGAFSLAPPGMDVAAGGDGVPARAPGGRPEPAGAGARTRRRSRPTSTWRAGGSSA